MKTARILVPALVVAFGAVTVSNVNAAKPGIKHHPVRTTLGQHIPLAQRQAWHQAHIISHVAQHPQKTTLPVAPSKESGSKLKTALKITGGLTAAAVVAYAAWKFGPAVAAKVASYFAPKVAPLAWYDIPGGIKMIARNITSFPSRFASLFA